MSDNLWLSLITSGVTAARPTAFPAGNAPIAMFYDTTLKQLFIAPYTTGTPDWQAIGGVGYVAVPDAATYTVLAANSGKVHALPNFTANCTVSLPAPALGLEFEFVGSGFAADAQSWIFTTGSDLLFFLGGVLHLDTDADAAGDEVVSVFPDGNSNSKLTCAVPNPGGSRVRFIADGTHYIIQGQIAGATAPAFADQ